MTESEALYSRSQGAGEHVIMLHGLFGSMENLGAIAKPLAEHFTVHSLDLPNHGRSPHTAELNLGTMAQAVKDWMDLTGIHQARVFGHSLGGKTAMELALTYPDRVTKLVVADIAPVVYPPHHDEVFAGLLSIEPDSLGSRTEADQLLLPYVPETAVRSFLLKNLVKEEESGFRWRLNLPVIHRSYAALISANRDDKSFAGPVLFLKGGNSDYYIGEQYRNDIVSRFPAAELKVVANTGHWLHAEKPDLVASLSLKFFLEP